jgi:phage FluMu protein Com
MQIRCSHCHRPYALGKDAVHAALDTLQAEDLSHYNAQCPHCGRTNRVSRQELERSAPDWTPAESTTETPGSSDTSQT